MYIPLTLLINQSLQSGIFSDKLKIAKVVPIFKAGKDNIDSYVHNYRPISLLSCFSKIFERIVYNQLYNHLQLNKLLYESQYFYGFRKSHSTELAALELIDSIYTNLDQGKTPIAILDDTFKMQCLKFYYKCIQGKLPPFFFTHFLLKKLPLITT